LRLGVKQHSEGILWTLSIGTLLVAGLAHSRLLLLILAAVWMASTAVVIPLHFYRAWNRWPLVPNKLHYAAWLGFETTATALLILLGIFRAIFN
jgi:hypothetical protein